MKELSEKELLTVAGSGEAFGIFFYTPTCGTCKLTSRMLEAVELLLPAIPFYACNVNTAPRLVAGWQIRSVPCAGFIRNGEPSELRYRMGDAGELYRFYQQQIET
jgi:thiol-disulfide isomerase/thioredoxin